MLNNEKLKELEALGAVFYSLKKCAIVLEVKETELKEVMENEKSQEYLHYMRGALQSEFKLRQSVIDLALRGSSNAQTEVFGMIRKLKNDE